VLQVEATWDEGGGDEGGTGGGVAMEQSAAPPKPGVAAGGCTDEYIDLFLMKYVCPRPECFGTMAPLRGSDATQCSMCGHARSEAEFLAEVQAFGG